MGHTETALALRPRQSGPINLAVVNPSTATAEHLRDFAIQIRDEISSMTADELDQLDALLVAVAKRLRQLKGDAAHAEASRVLCLRRIGQVIGPAERGGPTGNQHASKTKSPGSDLEFTPTEKNRRSHARLLAEFAPLAG